MLSLRNSAIERNILENEVFATILNVLKPLEIQNVGAVDVRASIGTSVGSVAD
eukprot:SAG31_NODE_1016_length_10365_cov_16.138418_2_plen_53_part_00